MAETCASKLLKFSSSDQDLSTVVLKLCAKIYKMAVIVLYKRGCLGLTPLLENFFNLLKVFKKKIPPLTPPLIFPLVL